MKNVPKCFLFSLLIISCNHQKHALVLQTDFGLKDAAVNEMKGVAIGIDPDLEIFDLTHEIPSFNIWEASYRLYQAAPFWPSGTVFVSVVDPGVGTTRKSVVMRSKSGQYFVTPDNGTLTLVSEALGIDAVREIDEHINRRPGSDSSFTFHGRDVYVYTAARLASGKIQFEQVGPLLNNDIVRLNYQKPTREGNAIRGNIPVLDVQYGNVWTNIPDSLFRKLNVAVGDSVFVEILHNDSVVFKYNVPYVQTFGEVKEGKPLAYLNSLMNFSLALNMGSFADSFHVKSGSDWSIVVSK
jgi:S-adenosylmethionine hydrolase